MRFHPKPSRSIWCNQDGATAVEYAVLAATLVLGLAALLMLTGGSTEDLYNIIVTNVEKVVG